MIRSRSRRALLVLTAAALLLSACTSGSERTSGGATHHSRSTQSSQPGYVPTAQRPCGGDRHRPTTYEHVVWIVLENHTYDDIIGSSQAPYLNQLAARCGLATNFSAEAHPSLPNYIAMTSGSTQGITDDAGPRAHQLDVPNIFSQTKGNWRGLAESMPEPCARTSSGDYAARHNPAVYYTNVAGECAERDVPLGSTPDLSAAFTFITPNLCHTMHSCDEKSPGTSQIRTGDNWLEQLVPRLVTTKEYRAGKTVIVITWDEGSGRDQHIPTLVISTHTAPGTRGAGRFDHYSLLRTTEDLLGLGHLGAAAQAPSMRAAFGL